MLVTAREDHARHAPVADRIERVIRHGQGNDDPYKYPLQAKRMWSARWFSSAKPGVTNRALFEAPSDVSVYVSAARRHRGHREFACPLATFRRSMPTCRTSNL
ncbi:hypothetical protein [Nocardia veterana]|uniref:Uncharacterized protein n=1 Tax=Nocardia veterana TaxID=132249 RepID=A0A7X6M4M3_9NOCA|nr:hypothetical protein [Nocardia veterana]NKY89744.1 hypothetical protein [Nocardia veterana]